MFQADLETNADDSFSSEPNQPDNFKLYLIKDGKFDGQINQTVILRRFAPLNQSDDLQVSLKTNFSINAWKDDINKLLSRS